MGVEFATLTFDQAHPTNATAVADARKSASWLVWCDRIVGTQSEPPSVVSDVHL